MPGLIDHITFLSNELGPRPAGTEEEQQAALYFAEQMQKDAGLPTAIEDFSNGQADEVPSAICAALTLIVTVLAMFFSIMAIPALLITAIAGVLLVLEIMDKPVLSKFLPKGVSQNVVARYEPTFTAEGGTRRRKIVIVANLDSGKVQKELSGSLLSMLPNIKFASFCAMVGMPVFLFMRFVFFLHADGALLIFLNIITVLALLVSSVPIYLFLVHNFASYNDAANSNASGIATMLEIASRLSVGRMSTAAQEEGAGDIAIHGEEAARASGLVPEGAQILYDAAQVQAPERAPQTEEERLLEAKAAIAALTGRSVPHKPQTSVAEKLVNMRETPVGAPTGDELINQQEEMVEEFEAIPETMKTERAKGINSLIPEAQVDAGAGAAGIASSAEAAGVVAEASSAQESTPELGADQSASDQLDSPTAQVAYQAPSNQAAADASVPDWFRKAQENAKKSKDPDNKTVQRSRFADALDAVADSPSRFVKPESAYGARNDASPDMEERLRKMREDIMEAGSSKASRRDAGVSQIPVQTEMPTQDLSNEAPRREEAAAATNAALGSTTAMPPIDVNELRGAIQEPLPASFAEGSQSAPQASDWDNSLMADWDALEAKEAPISNQPVVLPDVGVVPTSLPSLSGASLQQRAPLAQANEESTESAARSLLNMLPTIESDVQKFGSGGIPGLTKDAATNRSALFTSLPSFSGPIKTDASGAADAMGAENVEEAAPLASAGLTGALTPLNNEAFGNEADENDYIDDVDDSDYDSGLTETGALTGPGYVEMPKSRVRRFFDKLSFKKDVPEEKNAQEWLDIDEDFDARSVGAARKGWESFQENNDGDDDADKSWQGGAFSRDLVDASMDSESLYDDNFEVQSALGDTGNSGLTGNSEEMRAIYQFRAANLATEVWFVALGSELANNAGMRAFLAEHEQELKGTIIININALGAGDLSYLEKEGLFEKATISSRMKRYISKASSASGVDAIPGSLSWANTSSSVAKKKGYQAMTVMGMTSTKPALFAQENDVVDSLDEEKLSQNVDFLIELLKNI